MPRAQADIDFDRSALCVLAKLDRFGPMTEESLTITANVAYFDEKKDGKRPRSYRGSALVQKFVEQGCISLHEIPLSTRFSPMQCRITERGREVLSGLRAEFNKQSA